MLITAPDGGIVNDPVLLRVEENRWWLALADSDAGLYAMGVAANAGMDVHVGHPEVYPVQVQGPKAKDTMRDLFGDWILDMKYYWCDEADLDGIPVVISRTGWTAGRRLRDLPARPEPRRRPVGADPRRRQALRHPRHAVVGHPPHRGRHLRLGLRHHAHRQPVRGDGSGASRRGAGGRLHREGGARTDPARGRAPASSSASRSRARRSSSPRSTGRRSTAASGSATSPTRAGRRAWRRTSATCGCRSSSRSRARRWSSTRTSATGAAPPPSSRSSIRTSGCLRRSLRWAAPARRGTIRR